MFDKNGLRKDRHTFKPGDEIKLSREFLKSTWCEDPGKMIAEEIIDLGDGRSLVKIKGEDRSILNLNLRHYKAKELE